MLRNITNTGGKIEDTNMFKLNKKIESGSYDNYHVRNINGVKTPVSNPDSKSGNNLG